MSAGRGLGRVGGVTGLARRKPFRFGVQVAGRQLDKPTAQLPHPPILIGENGKRLPIQILEPMAHVVPRLCIRALSISERRGGSAPERVQVNEAARQE